VPVPSSKARQRCCSQLVVCLQWGLNVPAPGRISQKLLLQLRNAPQGLQGRVHVAGIAQILQTCRCSALELCSFRLIHVLEELDGLLWLLDDVCVSRGRAHHHQRLARPEAQLRHVGIVLELAALDDDLLALGLDAGDGEELVLERLAVGRGVDFHLVLLALVLYRYCTHLRLAT
jgi:hypothetical protein